MKNVTCKHIKHCDYCNQYYCDNCKCSCINEVGDYTLGAMLFRYEKYLSGEINYDDLHDYAVEYKKISKTQCHICNKYKEDNQKWIRVCIKTSKEHAIWGVCSDLCAKKLKERENNDYER